MLINQSTLKLLRIPFSFFLMPLFLLALSQAKEISWTHALASFVIIHFFIYPASNGYNSYIDKDESSIGGLEKPPAPTKNLFYVTLFLDCIALLLASLFIQWKMALCLGIYILASRAYSSRQIRLKKHPIIGFLIVVIFQGAFTFYMSILGITNQALELNTTNWFILLGCSFQIAGAYPLTQIYQHEQDLKDGVTTLSFKLGYKGTFVFTALMFAVCNVFYYLYFKDINQTNSFFIIQLFFVPIVSYFAYWFYLVLKDNGHANFKNTMNMNWIAACCMNCCFIVLFLKNYF
jgi:4-hydroxybenzoate polyprenyltransferase